MTENGHIAITNTALAAYLVTEGFDPDEVIADGFPSVFLFADSPELRAYCHKWEVIDAPTNAVIYYSNYKRCLKAVKTGVLV